MAIYKNMKKKYSFPTKKEMSVLKKFIASEPNKNMKQIENASQIWLRAHWENKLSYEVNWMGIPVIQTAEDMIIMQEIIYDVRPDFIIETGIAHGGSLIYFASLLEILGKGRVIGIDIEIRKHNKILLEKHPMVKRITSIEGDSTSKEIFEKIRNIIPEKSKILVILDSNHTRDHVLKELNLYSSLVSRGSYIIVEDTIMPEVAGYKHAKDYYSSDNTKQAINIFMKDNKKFIIDRTREKLGFTYFSGGFLKKIK